MFEKFAAIYTVYHPDKGFFDRISPVVSNCAIAIVIDNTPGGADLRSPSSNIIVLSDGINKGLGKALNIGLKEANFRKCDAVVLFDQDSTPDEKFITALKMGLNTAGVGGIVGPKLIDDSECENVESFSNCGVEDVENFEKISCLATSGMCFGLEALNTGNWFSEDFFLDFVDFVRYFYAWKKKN